MYTVYETDACNVHSRILVVFCNNNNNKKTKTKNKKKKTRAFEQTYPQD